MADKDTIDYCKNCSVEPPAMKFKCPECKHNPNKEQVICKYKFQDKEKFDGKPYCTCFCELCEDLPPCDDNCQIYEDYKRLTCKTSECEKLKEKFKKFFNIDNQECWDIAFLKDENARYRRALNDIGKIVIQDRNIKDVCLISTCLDAGRVAYDIQQQIIDIINKAKGRGDD